MMSSCMMMQIHGNKNNNNRFIHHLFIICVLSSVYEYDNYCIQGVNGFSISTHTHSHAYSHIHSHNHRLSLNMNDKMNRRSQEIQINSGRSGGRSGSSAFIGTGSRSRSRTSNSQLYHAFRGTKDEDYLYGATPATPPATTTGYNHQNYQSQNYQTASAPSSPHTNSHTNPHVPASSGPHEPQHTQTQTHTPNTYGQNQGEEITSLIPSPINYDNDYEDEDEYNDDAKYSVVIGKGSILNLENDGTLTFSDSLLIEGSLIGKVECTCLMGNENNGDPNECNDTLLKISVGGELQADVINCVMNVVIEGKFVGDIWCDRLVVGKDALLVGDVMARSVCVEEGATIIGAVRCGVGAAPQITPSSPSVSSSTSSSSSSSLDSSMSNNSPSHDYYNNDKNSVPKPLYVDDGNSAHDGVHVNNDIYANNGVHTDTGVHVNNDFYANNGVHADNRVHTNNGETNTNMNNVDIYGHTNNDNTNADMNSFDHDHNGFNGCDQSNGGYTHSDSNGMDTNSYNSNSVEYDYNNPNNHLSHQNSVEYDYSNLNSHLDNHMKSNNRNEDLTNDVGLGNGPSTYVQKEMNDPNINSYSNNNHFNVDDNANVNMNHNDNDIGLVPSYTPAEEKKIRWASRDIGNYMDASKNVIVPIADGHSSKKNGLNNVQMKNNNNNYASTSNSQQRLQPYNSSDYELSNNGALSDMVDSFGNPLLPKREKPKSKYTYNHDTTKQPSETGDDFGNLSDMVDSFGNPLLPKRDRPKSKYNFNHDTTKQPGENEDAFGNPLMRGANDHELAGYRQIKEISAVTREILDANLREKRKEAIEKAARVTPEARILRQLKMQDNNFKSGDNEMPPFLR